MNDAKKDRQDVKVAAQVLDVSRNVVKKIIKNKKLPWPEQYAETFWDYVYENKYDDLLIQGESALFVSGERQEYFIEQANSIINDFAEDIEWLEETATECRRTMAAPVKTLLEKASDRPDFVDELKKILVYLRKLENGLAEAGKRADVQRSRMNELKNELRLDELTMTLNRRALFKDLDSEIKKSKRYGHPVSIMMVDLDHFKKVNDMYGHQAGDIILSHVAGIMQDCIRESDSLYRYGGEEFLIILPHVDIKGASVMADRLRSIIASYSFLLKKGRARISVTVSVGCAQLKEEGESVGSLIDRADDALYKAKTEGRNRIICI